MAVSSKNYQSFLNNLVAKNIISKNEHQSLSNSKAVDGYNQLKKTHCLLAKTLNRMLLALNTGDEIKTKKKTQKLGSKLYLKDNSLSIRQGVIFTKQHSIGTISSFEDLKNEILNHINQSELTKASEKLIALNKIAQSVPEFRIKLDHFEQNELLGATNVKALDMFLKTDTFSTKLSIRLMALFIFSVSVSLISLRTCVGSLLRDK